MQSPVSCTNPLGTGVYTDVTDVIFVPKELFDVTKTQEIRKEIAELNDRMKLENRNHILIGPGRWGLAMKCLNSRHLGRHKPSQSDSGI